MAPSLKLIEWIRQQLDRLINTEVEQFQVQFIRQIQANYQQQFTAFKESLAGKAAIFYADLLVKFNSSEHAIDGEATSKNDLPEPIHREGDCDNDNLENNFLSNIDLNAMITEAGSLKFQEALNGLRNVVEGIESEDTTPEPEIEEIPFEDYLFESDHNFDLLDNETNITEQFIPAVAMPNSESTAHGEPAESISKDDQALDVIVPGDTTDQLAISHTIEQTNMMTVDVINSPAAAEVSVESLEKTTALSESASATSFGDNITLTPAPNDASLETGEKRSSEDQESFSEALKVSDATLQFSESLPFPVKKQKVPSTPYDTVDHQSALLSMPYSSEMSLKSQSPLLPTPPDWRFQDSNGMYRTVRLYCHQRDCLNSFSTFNELEVHLRQAHLTLPIRCQMPQCMESVWNLSMFRDHYNQFHASQLPMCAQCVGVKIKDSTELYHHDLDCHHAGKFSCIAPDCLFRGFTRHEVTGHYNETHHKDDSPIGSTSAISPTPETTAKGSASPPQTTDSEPLVYRFY